MTLDVMIELAKLLALPAFGTTATAFVIWRGRAQVAKIEGDTAVRLARINRQAAPRHRGAGRRPPRIGRKGGGPVASA